MYKPEVEAALRDLTERLAERFPEIKSELACLSDAESAQGALVRLTQLAQTNPEMGVEINRLAMEAFAPLREEPEHVVPDPEASKQLPAFNPLPNALGFNTEDLIFKAPGARLPQLDPAVEAAIAERAQFDGDIPELRSGNMPEGGRAAVPISTTARSPVAIGQMLQQASEEVGEETKELDFDHVQKLTDMGVEVREDGSLNLPAHISRDDVSLVAPDPEGYKRGSTPALRTAVTPSGSALAKLGPEDRAASAWEALSTTQGRRSAVAVIRELVEVSLRSGGLDVRSNEHPDLSRDDIPVCVEWTQSLSGPRGTQGNFSFIDVASKVLTKKLLDKLSGGLSIADPVLEVIPINTVDVRQVGWAARLVEGGA